MRINLPARFAAMGLIFGALACASNTARTDDETGAAPVDTTAIDDTATTDTVRNPEGYQGMERDTAMVPPEEGTPTDTFLQEQGTGVPEDTAGYGGLEKVDTTAQVQTDTAGYGQADTTGAVQPGVDTSGYAQPDTTGAAQPGADTTGYGQPGADTTSYGQPGGDTTGYGQPADTTQVPTDSVQADTGTGVDTSGYDQSQHQQHGDSTGQLQDSTSP